MQRRLKQNWNTEKKRATQDVSVPVRTVYRKELSDILTRWYDMMTEISNYDNAKTRLLRTAEVVGTEQNPQDSLKIIFSEELLLLSNKPSFLLIDHKGLRENSSCLRLERL